MLLTNQTRRTRSIHANASFESTVNHDEIFVYCVSRSLSDELRRRFEALVCVEILRPQTFCERIKMALPGNATFRAGRVKYYRASDEPGARWALSDQIALSKFESYQWQAEFRLLFSLTDALGFEKGTYRIVFGEANPIPKSREHPKHPLKVRSLRDICRIREF